MQKINIKLHLNAINCLKLGTETQSIHHNQLQHEKNFTRFYGSYRLLPGGQGPGFSTQKRVPGSLDRYLFWYRLA